MKANNTIESIEFEIEDVIFNSEEYPTAMQLAESVVGEDPFKFGLYIRALTNLTERGVILYDDKHDSWIYIKSTEKMKEWMDKAVRIL